MIVHDDASIDAEELSRFCKGQIAHYKIPRYIKFVDGFPMTVTGKIQKYKMREESIKELGLEEVRKEICMYSYMLHHIKSSKDEMTIFFAIHHLPLQKLL